MGLVVSFAVGVLGTFWALHPGTATVVATAIVEGSTLVGCAAVLLLPWRRLPQSALLVFPAILVASEAALSLSTRGVSPNYVGFFTLGFVYLGLTQSRRTVALFALLAVPAWLLGQETLTAALAIRLCLALAIWLLTGDALAKRAERDRADKKSLVARGNTDLLSGLASRPALMDGVARLLPEPGACLLMGGLDGFKTINDTFGHTTGDELVVAVAKRLCASTRPGDLVARLDGDEFAILLGSGGLAQAAQVAERVLRALAEPFPLSRGRVAITASIGIVALDMAATPEEALEEADIALYEAKSSGRNRTATYEREMQQRVARRVELETQLCDALAAGQFEVYYQPLVNLGTRDIVGAEALLRWHHPTRGLLAPGAFLAAAEEIGIMLPLGRRVLAQACGQARSWQGPDPGRALTVTVNVSAPEIFAADFIEQVEHALAQTDLGGEALVLEITERVLMADYDLARRRLEGLRALGVRTAIDDFGTGYSSLAYLREFPVDIMKIDRSFVTGLGVDSQATSLLRSILAIAEALMLDVIVEGVETGPQADLLADLGCGVAQGYYLGRPGTAEAFSALLALPAQPKMGWSGLTGGHRGHPIIDDFDDGTPSGVSHH